MSDPTNDDDIDALLRRIDPHCEFCGFIDAVDCARYHRALTALVAERDKAKSDFSAAWRERSEFAKRIDEADGAIFAVVAERNALRERVAELESQQPATSDLRERLVCAALTGLCVDPRHDFKESFAVAIADRTLAAMRKGEE